MNLIYRRKMLIQFVYIYIVYFRINISYVRFYNGLCVLYIYIGILPTVKFVYFLSLGDYEYTWQYIGYNTYNIGIGVWMR